ncbi:MAG: hypothetical protein C5S48_06960 [Candidatus Methanogaster sp.]|nr:MAG: hypothetical protein C5S48_06960 [ANME-2 cluster archaeon]
MSRLLTFVITETEPTPLLRDFATFTGYLSTHNIVLTRTNRFLSGRDLYELNQEMTHPLPDATPRTGQGMYPLLHLFYHLVLAGKLFRKVSEKGRLALKPTERLQAYEELKLTERYFFLLETFWIDTDWKTLKEGCFGGPSIYTVPHLLESLIEQQPGKRIYLKGEEAYDMSQLLWNWGYFLLYFSFFGFWEVTRDEDMVAPNWPKRSFPAETMTPSTFGVTMAEVLREARNLFYWNLPYHREFGELDAVPGSPLPDEGPLTLFRMEPEKKRSKASIRVDKGEPGDPFFLPFAPLFAEGELQKTLPRERIEFVDGTYIFRVTLAKNLWRRIEISADDTLLDLHSSIQEAYDFDYDHLYSFFMDGRPWSRERFVSPYEDDGPYVDEVSIGNLGLYVGQNILYLFDYGDEWYFQVKLEEIRKEGSKPREPTIIEEEGEAPEQYEYYEE